MNNILLVEDSRVVSNAIRRRLEGVLDCAIHTTQTLAETKAFLEANDDPICLGLLDLTLPDALDGEVVEFVTEQGIPSVVVTGTFTPEIRKRVMGMNVIDYVVKDSPSSLTYLVSLVRRIVRNRQTKVLVVDDSKTSRKYLASLLHTYQFRVMTADSGHEALEIVAATPEIRLVVTDYNMPGMDGFELIRELRKTHDKERMAIIGLSGQAENELSVKFIKIGANDFLSKPFMEEEFFCRVSQNMDNLDQLEELRDAATKDFLTRLYNRRYFFDTAEPMFKSARHTGRPLSVAMFDVDHFKSVNDTYGHDAGDEVLKALADILREEVRDEDMPARFGGEEFCVLVDAMEPKALQEYFDGIRKRIEATPIDTGEHTLNITASVGVCPTLRDSLDDMLAAADAMLYEAKEGGRNQVVLAD